MLFEELNKAVLYLNETLPHKTKTIIMQSEYNNLISYHFSIGIFIRTNLLDNTTLYHLLKSKGMKNKDDMSILILQLFYLYINNKTP